MQIDRRLVGFGPFLITVGAVMVAVRQGLLAEATAGAANDFDEHDLTEVGGAWETAGHATAEVRIALRAEVNAGSLSLDPVRTCAG